jgi:hypothetical protein
MFRPQAVDPPGTADHITLALVRSLPKVLASAPPPTGGQPTFALPWTVRSCPVPTGGVSWHSKLGCPPLRWGAGLRPHRSPGPWAGPPPSQRRRRHALGGVPVGAVRGGARRLPQSPAVGSWGGPAWRPAPASRFPENHLSRRRINLRRTHLPPPSDQDGTQKTNAPAISAAVIQHSRTLFYNKRTSCALISTDHGTLRIARALSQLHPH